MEEQTDFFIETSKPDEDVVTPLPKPQMQKKKGIKKSVSLNVSGPGGIEVDMNQNQSNNKRNKKKNKSKGRHARNNSKSGSFLFLDLNSFKINKCIAGSNHNPKKCLNYHDFKRDRRRPLGAYSSEYCLSMNKAGD